MPETEPVKTEREPRFCYVCLENMPDGRRQIRLMDIWLSGSWDSDQQDPDLWACTDCRDLFLDLAWLAVLEEVD